MSEFETQNTEQPELAYDPTPILQLRPDSPTFELTEEEIEIQEKRDKAQRCKVIALAQMNLHPITTNVSRLKKQQKEKLLKLVEEFFKKDNSEIINEFNQICIETVFETIQDEDYTKFPIYKRPIRKTV
jgi:hypothetical protein